mgnify:FL=1
MIILNLKQVVAEYKSDKIDFNDRNDQYILEPLTKLDFLYTFDQIEMGESIDIFMV